MVEIVGGPGRPTWGDRTPPAAWEYEILSMVDEAMFREKLNELGACGWELVHANSHFVTYRPLMPGEGRGGAGGGSLASGYTEWNATLKRPK